MDNRPIEKLGEKYIESRLIKYHFDTHSDLSFDREGGDLIITQKVDKKTLHFIKIQSKARRIKKSANVSIPTQYVDDNFVLFIYLIDESLEENLLCFFKEDFEIFTENNGNFILNISHNKLQKNFQILFLIMRERDY